MKVLLLASLLGCVHAQTPDVHEIMSRVAANQAKALAARQHFVYRQKEDVRLRRGNGRLAREEHREYQAAPAARGVKKELVAFDGRYEKSGTYVSYDRPGYEYKEMDIDAGLAEGFGEEMTNDPDAQDGIASQLFPLTSQQQSKYEFRLIGTESFRNRPVYRVVFEPHADTIWKGDALIDAAEYQPVFVSTKMARPLPLVVRTLFGTNVRGLGFSVFYQKFDEGVWFPVSYGGEFELRAVFFYKRTISISLLNFDFRRADVTSSVTYSLADR